MVTGDLVAGNLVTRYPVTVLQEPSHAGAQSLAGLSGNMVMQHDHSPPPAATLPCCVFTLLLLLLITAPEQLSAPSVPNKSPPAANLLLSLQLSAFAASLLGAAVLKASTLMNFVNWSALCSAVGTQ